MNFELVFEKVISSFEEENIRYGLIGGFALGVMGILRSTMDIDFLLLADDTDKVDKILTESMYHCVYKTENISQYSSDIKALGNIDIIHAFRKLSQEMLSRTKTFKVFGKHSIQVLAPEDIIGLKVQAISNNPSREALDVQDMRFLIEYMKEQNQKIDWELLTEYFTLFDKQSLLKSLKEETQ